MQKLFRLRALDSPLSTKKESPSGKRSSVVELSSQDLSLSRVWSSPSQSVHCASEKLLHRSTSTAIQKPFQRILSSPLPIFMPKSSEPLIERDSASTSSKEGSVTVSSGKGSGNYSGPKTIWNENDSYLPRAKPPPPLKRIKHSRNRSEGNVSDQAASTRTSSGQSSESYATAPCSPRRSLDMLAIEIPRDGRRLVSVDDKDALTRTSSRTTIVSVVSDDSEVTFTPANPNWNPPSCWAGPSEDPNEGDRPKLVRWFSRKKGVERTLKRSSTHGPAHLSHPWSLRRERARRDAGERNAEEDSVTQEGRMSSGVVVTIQCYEGDGWHEKPVVDIIPKLRELKLK